MKILIVDDDLSNRSLMKTVLMNNGYEVVLAINGENALEILKSEPIDLIVSDIMMPGMDGYHLCQECKADISLCNIPFIFCSGTYTDPKDESLSLEFGADAFIVKPFQTQDLVALVARVMESAGRGAPECTGKPRKDPGEVYKLYNERLVTKLEEKMLALDKEKMALEMEVAERRKVEDRLRKSRDFAESLFYSAPGIVLILDTEGKIVRFNPYMEKISGYRLDDVTGRYWREVFSPGDTGKKFLDASALKNGEDIYHGNVSSIITRNGEKKEILWFDSTLKDESGKIIGLLAVGREIPRFGIPHKGGDSGECRDAHGIYFKDAIQELDATGLMIMEIISLLERGMNEKDKDYRLLKKINDAAHRIRELAFMIIGGKSSDGTK